ncbi:MAG: excinuclease ABC subunit UvrC [Desulfobacterales bacterium]|nr:excinuclease ABC subunit UvrC [Desulfobacterales bacterium]
MVSSEPGVYFMKDALGQVIYVGKARNLKQRLSSYFSAPGPLNLKTGILVQKTATFETIITQTEKEALILESNLIKRYRPRYNVILKDDKQYPSLRLDAKTDFPHLAIARKIEKNNDLYFGPYASSRDVRRTLNIINRTFKLRKCKTRDFKNRLRPCLNHQMNFCLAPCCNKVSKAAYGKIVKEVVLFLKGRTPKLIHQIKDEMESAAITKDYENAAVLRDRMFALQKTLEKQVALTTDFMDRDIIAVARAPELSLVLVMIVRGGYLIETRQFGFAEVISTDAEMISTFIRQYYEKVHVVPKEILVPLDIEDGILIEQWLEGIKKEKVRLLRPQRGEKARLIEIAQQNAENTLRERISQIASDMDFLVRLQGRLKMKKIPRRIECFDNSHISGQEPVAAMAVFEDGRPNKSACRRYRIKTVDKQDDYACMYEILKRRFTAKDARMPYPDLLIVDGGKGHLNIADTVIRELNIDMEFTMIGIAKKDEKQGEVQDKIYVLNQSNPINFGREGDLLLFLQRVRDEAHRLAITFFRRRQRKASVRSALDAIPGVGKKRKGVLLKNFGSITKIKAATFQELCRAPGMNPKVAAAIQAYFAANK